MCFNLHQQSLHGCSLLLLQYSAANFNELKFLLHFGGCASGVGVRGGGGGVGGGSGELDVDFSVTLPSRAFN